MGPDSEAAGDGRGRFDHDVIVIGSGFGGSVAALRLSEKGYDVGVLEAGRRFRPDELPASSWDVRNFLWAPRLGLRGIQRISLLRDVVILAGAGVGGGSLVYANTLYEPLGPFYDDPQWAGITDWRAELAPFYDQASRMLGVTEDTETSPSTRSCEKSPRRWAWGRRSTTPGSGCFSACRAARSTIRTSAAQARRRPAACAAVSA